MKKIMCMILALVMVMSLNVTAMADEEKSEKTGTVTITDKSKEYRTTIEVPAKGNVADFTSENETYYVEMTWSVESTLTYTVNTTDYVWNVYNVSDDDDKTETKLTNNDATAESKPTATMGRYDVNGKWSGTATIKVDVKNWSNVAVQATATWADSKKPGSGAADNGVTKDIKTTGITPQTKTFARADSSINEDNYAEEQITNLGSTELFNVTIDNTSTDAICKITDGAIKDTTNGDPVTIGTLTVTITKTETT